MKPWRVARPSSPRFRLAAVSAAASAFLAVSTPAVFAAARTTGTPPPARVAVTLTDHKISMKGPVARNSAQWYPRGAVIDFILHNNGEKAVHVRVKRLTKVNFPAASQYSIFTVAPGKAIRPGNARHFTLNFFYRGSFVMQMIAGGKVQASTRILIF
jgi:hypothetical protein